MDQLELVQHAKDCIDALADGIDPTSGRELLEDTVLNHPGMIRCFFHVSDILRQVVENGGQVTAKKAGRKQPPSPPAERRQGLNRAYAVTLYNETAQRFIMDNLDNIAGVSGKRGKTPGRS